MAAFGSEVHTLSSGSPNLIPASAGVSLTGANRAQRDSPDGLFGVGRYPTSLNARGQKSPSARVRARQGRWLRLPETSLDACRWVDMSEDPHQLRLTPDQCRERARLVRNLAEGVRSALLRQDLLDVANDYERRAETRPEQD